MCLISFFSFSALQKRRENLSLISAVVSDPVREQQETLVIWLMVECDICGHFAEEAATSSG